jgi:hypothetical protein
MPAFKIKTKADEFGTDFVIYSAKSAGKAKYNVITDLMNAGYREPTFSWITSCVREPTYDLLASTNQGCIAWENGNRHWQIQGSST